MPEAKEKNSPPKKFGTSTQSFLAISEIKDDAIVTLDNGLRGVVAVSSTNFVLKSQEEQNAILARYQNFLNMLDFPIQILVQSRRLDISGYLEKVSQQEMQQTNELLRIQTEEYVEYIKKLLEYGNIMNKTFYVIVHYSQDPIKTGFMHRISRLINPSQQIAQTQQKLGEGLTILADRVARVEGGMTSLGLRTMRLHTAELAELLYNSYNVGAAAASGLHDFGSLKLY